MVAAIKIEGATNSDITPSKTHLFHLFGLQFKQGQTTESFYDQFRNYIIACLKKKGDIITWQNNAVLTEDEELSPTFEELILAIALGLIDTRLPGHVCDSYHDKDGKVECLMDYKMDILGKVPTFLGEIDLSLWATTKIEGDSLARYGTKCKCLVCFNRGVLVSFCYFFNEDLDVFTFKLFLAFLFLAMMIM
jgi:hypothetical protein